MSPSTHLLLSWLAATKIGESRRERVLLTLSGVIADLDGAGLLIDMAAPLFGHHANLWSSLHHKGHTIWAALLTSLLIVWLTKTNMLKMGFCAFFLFHLHILCDLIGSRGPDGYQWPIAYFYPFYPDVLWAVNWQWELNSWPNILFTLTILVFVIRKAKSLSASPFELISKKLDNTFLKMITRKASL